MTYKDTPGRIDDLINFITSNTEFLFLFDLLYDIGFNPFEYTYNGQNLFHYLMNKNNPYRRFHFEDVISKSLIKFESDVIRLVNTKDFFNMDVHPYITILTTTKDSDFDSSSLYNLFILLKDTTVLYTDIFNLILSYQHRYLLNWYLNYLFENTSIRKQLIVTEKGNINIVDIFDKCNNDVQRLDLYKNLNRFKNNINFDDIKSLSLIMYVVKLERRVEHLENELSRSSDKGSPAKKAKLDSDGASKLYYNK
jgi:hypothetical protein